MPSEYTPPTEDVRALYVTGTPAHHVSVSKGYTEFDRWLAAHDRDVAATERERCARIAEKWWPANPFHAHDIANAIRAAGPVEPQQKEGHTYFDTLRDLDPGGTMTEIIDASEARVAQQKEGN